MKKTAFRYFFDFINGQEQWLNRMSEKGCRLKKCGILSYTFERSAPGEYEYRVEFVGEKSAPKAKRYRSFLEEMGYRTLTKNINLNYVFGKIRWRPWGKCWGQIAVSPGSYNRELLIVEKKRDGKPFELHTDLRDRLSRCRAVCKGYAWALLSLLAILACTLFIPGAASVPGFWLWVIRAAAVLLLILYGIPAAAYYKILRSLKKEIGTS